MRRDNSVKFVSGPVGLTVFDAAGKTIAAVTVICTSLSSDGCKQAAIRVTHKAARFDISVTPTSITITRVEERAKLAKRKGPK